ncbi:MAG: hemolysin family protein [Alphaproteobacteria bacterium]|nr:hemolysin family protein [Alphaproteobacteria bacterium]
MSEDNSKTESLMDKFRKFCNFKPKETVREAIEDLLDDSNGNELKTISDHEKLLLNNVLYLHNKKCHQVMTSRANIIAFQKNGKIIDLAEMMINKGHSRLPIYGENLDDIVGIVHIIDLAKFLIAGDKEAPVESIIKNGVKFVSPSIRVPDLLLEMQSEKVHMAIVVDEYGGIDGLVTIEDLLEEIVGDIEDEYDIDETSITIQKDDNKVIADAKATLEEIEEVVGSTLFADLDLEELEIETLGGLILHYTQRIPNLGEVIKAENEIEYRILDVDPRKVKKVMIILPQKESNAKKTI